MGVGAARYRRSEMSWRSSPGRCTPARRIEYRSLVASLRCPGLHRALPVGGCVCMGVDVWVCEVGAVGHGPYLPPAACHVAGGRPLGEVRAQRLRVRAPVDYLGNCGCG